MIRRTVLLTVSAVTALAFTCSAALAVPIADPVPTTLPTHTGSAAKAKPAEPTVAPQNPYMAKNPNNNIHDDMWMTDAYQRSGPLGKSLVTTSEAKPPSLCGSITFDSKGRIVTVCPSAAAPPQARIIDPNTLETLAKYDLPQAVDPPGTKTYQNFTGGGYFFLDNKDQIWAATKTNHLFVLAESADATSFDLVRDVDLNAYLDSDQRITSALPAYDGTIWFVSKKDGKIGTYDRKTGRVRVITTGEEIENSFAVGEGGVFIVSDKAMYRFKESKKGYPVEVWRSKYKNSGVVKPSQVDAGSGTTPTLMKGGYVSITDNADPMNVVVYRRAPKLKKGQKRVVCEVPIFGKGASATENSIITAGPAMVIENNYGYQDPFGPTSGAVTTPGFVRVDVNANGKGCHKVWSNNEVRAPTVVPKLSTKTGLVYTYERKEDPLGGQPYFWAAIDFATGKTAWTQYAGSGLSFNNNYAGLALGPSGSAYLGTIGGIVKLSDGS